MDELKNISPIVNNITRAVPYTVPESYFSGLAGAMLSFVKLHSAEKLNPYHLPEDYFENLTLRSLAHIENTRIIADAGYEMPTGYFESLPQQILEHAKAADYLETGVYEELELLAPLLNKIPKQVYEAPAAYFDNLNARQINSTSEQTTETRVIPMKRKNLSRYFAAASTILVMAITAVLYINYDVNNKLTKRQVQRIAAVNVEHGINSLSDNEIMEFLKEQGQYSIDDGTLEFGQEAEATELINGATFEEL